MKGPWAAIECVALTRVLAYGFLGGGDAGGYRVRGLHPRGEPLAKGSSVRTRTPPAYDDGARCASWGTPPISLLFERNRDLDCSVIPSDP